MPFGRLRWNGYLGTACGRGLYLNVLKEKMSPLDQPKFDEIFSMSKFSLLSGICCTCGRTTLIYVKGINPYHRLKDKCNVALERFDMLITPTMAYVTARRWYKNLAFRIIYIKTLDKDEREYTDHTNYSLQEYICPIDYK